MSTGVVSSLFSWRIHSCPICRKHAGTSTYELRRRCNQQLYHARLCHSYMSDLMAPLIKLTTPDYMWCHRLQHARSTHL